MRAQGWERSPRTFRAHPHRDLSPSQSNQRPTSARSRSLPDSTWETLKFGTASGCQHGLHVFARFHFFEALMPVGQVADPADDGIEIKLTGHDHGDNALPDRPVVRKTARESNVLLDQGVEAELHGLRPPAYFNDLSRRTNGLQRNLQSAGGT